MTGFPYLNVARERKLDYAAVLCAVEMFELDPPGWPQNAPDHKRRLLATIQYEDLQVIHAVYRQERNRRLMVQGRRDSKLYLGPFKPEPGKSWMT